MEPYTVVHRIGDSGLVSIWHPKYGRQPWTRRKLRRATHCAVTGAELPVGALAYGPIDNGLNRGARISAAWVESAR